jgi:hypothetical protein
VKTVLEVRKKLGHTQTEPMGRVAVRGHVT